jgi:pimeloyl-ACP methyl ester carboxylesterase
LLWYRT